MRASEQPTGMASARAGRVMDRSHWDGESAGLT